MTKKQSKTDPQPFFKQSHNAWYVQIGGKQHRLGAEYDDEAQRKYHAELAKKPEKKPAEHEHTAAMLIDEFLVAMEIKVRRKKLAQRTYDWYDSHLQSFAKHIKSKIKVDQLKPFHVEEWLNKSYKSWSATSQNGAVRAVSRVFNWARKLGKIPANPISGYEREASEPRECYLTEDQWNQVSRLLIANDPFSDFVWFLYLTGCRPHEARTANDRHFDREHKALVFERKNSKGKKSRRVILLEGEALAIVKRRAGGDHIFTNRNGKPWTADALNCRFTRMRAKLREASEEFEVFPYIFRHTFITNALKRGLHPLTVAALVGHKDATMIIKVYSHLCQDNDHLRQELRRAIA